MSFFAVFIALFLEQIKPLPREHRARGAARSWLNAVVRSLDAGRPHHAQVCWWVALLVPVLVMAALHLTVASFSLILALLLDVLVLYFTLGFRQFSHHFTAIRDALARGDDDEARRVLARWQGIETSELPRTELLRQVLEYSLLAAHRHVFGVFFWFVLLSALGLGPAGAVLYRVAELAGRHWSSRAHLAQTHGDARLGILAQRWFALIDHVPARLTAAGFAAVGNFEEAVNAWRRDAELWPVPNEGVVLASAAGALGVQLGVPVSASAPAPNEAPASQTTPPQQAHLQSVVGLVWRSVVLWLMLLALLSLANILG
jgi:adenosylcobinamide-phosphate synthase